VLVGIGLTHLASLCSIEADHPSVPTWRLGSTARKGGQGCPQGTAQRRGTRP
jgi:hypothetical protein